MLHAIGIDIGGTNIKYGLADSSGNIGYESIRPTHQPQTTVYENILDIITEVSRASNSVPETIGIGVPAIIEDGIVTGCFTNLPDLDGMPLAARLGAATGARIAVGNDANLMGLAEWRYGAARGATDALFLTIGTGIGGAMVVNGEQYSGYRNRGSELGHIIVESQGNPCGCGGRGCLEAHASVKALIADYKNLTSRSGDITDNTSGDTTGNSIVSKYLDGEQPAVQAMNRHFDYLAVGLAGLINIFSPQLIVIGGGISESGDFYIDAIRERTMQRAMKETSLNTVIKAALLGNKAGFLGAAALAFNGAPSIR